MWGVRSVFVSSTFQDMHAERDHLRNYVFPELEERLRAQRQHLEWVDLRIGVATASEADEARRELQVLKVCLAEVRHCRPFLVVLLGDRYGTVPSPDRIKAAAREEGMTGNLSGRSVTDLEIDFGVFSDSDQQARSLFYFRNPLPYADMPTEVAAYFSDKYSKEPQQKEKLDRLARLKTRIMQSLPDRVRAYSASWDGHRVTGLEKWGRQVVEDLWKEFAANAPPPEAETSWQQTELNALEDYIEDRARDFVGREPILKHLRSISLSPPDPDAIWAGCVVGATGSGKSAIFAQLYRNLKQAEVMVLAHAAGASPRGPSIDSCLRRWIEELSTALEETIDLPRMADYLLLERTFTSLIERMASRKRVILLLDALDQFENTPQGRFASWLPRFRTTNVRIVATTVEGDASNRLSGLPGWDIISLRPLESDEAREIIAKISGKYHRKFEPAVVNALLAKRDDAADAWSRPLWLVLAVEELNLVDEDDFAHARESYDGNLRDLMVDRVAALPASIPQLYRATFNRADQLFGPASARGFLGLIAASRAGWRESDFRTLLPRVSGEEWDALRFARLRRLFRGQIRRHTELHQWDFAHAQMRVAVRVHLQGTEMGLHAAIAEHLLSAKRDDPLRQSETMVHLLASEDWMMAANYYGDKQLSVSELAGATRVLADTVRSISTENPLAGARTVCRLLDAPAMEIRATVANRFLYDLSASLEGSILSDTRLYILHQIRESIELLPPFSHHQHDLAIVHNQIGDLQRASDVTGAMESYQKALDIADVLTRTDPEYSDWQRDRCMTLKNLGEVLAKQAQLAEAMNYFQSSLVIAGKLAKNDPVHIELLAEVNMRAGEVHHIQGDFDAALKCYRDALVSRMTIVGSLSSSVARRSSAPQTDARRWDAVQESRMAIGDLQLERNNLQAALESFRESLAIAENLVRFDPSNLRWQQALWMSHVKVGDVRFREGAHPDALKTFSECLTIARRLAKENPGIEQFERSISVSCNRMGDVQVVQKDLSEALVSYSEGLVIAERLARDSHDAQSRHDLSDSYNNIGKVCLAQGNLTRADEVFRKALAIRERLAKSHPSDIRWQNALEISRSNMRDLEVAMRGDSSAKKRSGESSETSSRPAVSNPPDVLLQHFTASSWNKLLDDYDKLLSNTDIEQLIRGLDSFGSFPQYLLPPEHKENIRQIALAGKSDAAAAIADTALLSASQHFGRAWAKLDSAGVLTWFNEVLIPARRLARYPTVATECPEMNKADLESVKTALVACYRLTAFAVNWVSELITVDPKARQFLTRTTIPLSSLANAFGQLSHVADECPGLGGFFMDAAITMYQKTNDALRLIRQ